MSTGQTWKQNGTFKISGSIPTAMPLKMYNTGKGVSMKNSFNHNLTI